MNFAFQIESPCNLLPVLFICLFVFLLVLLISFENNASVMGIVYKHFVNRNQVSMRLYYYWLKTKFFSSCWSHWLKLFSKENPKEPFLLRSNFNIDCFLNEFICILIKCICSCRDFDGISFVYVVCVCVCVLWLECLFSFVFGMWIDFLRVADIVQLCEQISFKALNRMNGEKQREKTL